MERVYVKHLKEVINSGEDFLLINVQTPKEFYNEHIPGSVNIPINPEEEFLQRVESMAAKKSIKIFVYCGSENCSDSEKAAKILDKAGFSSALDFVGGLKEWKDANEPTTKL
ncbi:MAG: hypothetical protein Tsb0021_16140 [Chlamydiales bacterium]